ncbi:hypothetical protein [Vibrio parahaemolyticus]|uniref:hypothetical protein n=1 Tax=Vibrio parahaemolyticus TaxID=670 RepID=UPI00111E8971|nr:hypothetical protein [Vibrio parahaemolyticus]TOP83769.1 hypothetical protein CGH08_20855 [Vibrio parahaemolyticus]TOQ29772.1 hypothetical protein CGG99_09230 [Vibrio parahaemolyticus]
MIFKYANVREEFIYNLELTIRHFELLGEEKRDSFSYAFARLSQYQISFIRHVAADIQESNIKRWFIDLLRGYPFMSVNEIQRALEEIKAETESHCQYVGLPNESDDDDDDSVPNAHMVQVRGMLGQISRDKEGLVASLRTILTLDDVTKIRQEANNALSQYG